MCGHEERRVSPKPLGRASGERDQTLRWGGELPGPRQEPGGSTRWPRCRTANGAFAIARAGVMIVASGVCAATNSRAPSVVPFSQQQPDARDIRTSPDPPWQDIASAGDFVPSRPAHAQTANDPSACANNAKAMNHRRRTMRDIEGLNVARSGASLRTAALARSCREGRGLTPLLVDVHGPIGVLHRFQQPYVGAERGSSDARAQASLLDRLRDFVLARVDFMGG